VGDLDLLLVMTVNPGFPAQQFIAASIDKISRARQMLAERGGGVYLEVDGGVTLDTIAAIHAAGADTFVAGSAVFATDDPGRQVQELRKRCYPVA
jgi:ribulose-phosphate 3-epimerase